MKDAATQQRDLARLKNVLPFSMVLWLPQSLLVMGQWPRLGPRPNEGLLIAADCDREWFLWRRTALAFLSHEWGHFSGARLSGAVSPVLKERKSFFMFNFKTAVNSRAQFLAMSLGGPVANWLLVCIGVVGAAGWVFGARGACWQRLLALP